MRDVQNIHQVQLRQSLNLCFQRFACFPNTIFLPTRAYPSSSGEALVVILNRTYLKID